jgi:hypothetical protein
MIIIFNAPALLCGLVALAAGWASSIIPAAKHGDVSFCVGLAAGGLTDFLYRWLTDGERTLERALARKAAQLFVPNRGGHLFFIPIWLIAQALVSRQVLMP